MKLSTSSLRNWISDELLNDDSNKQSIINIVNYSINKRKNALHVKKVTTDLGENDFISETNFVDYPIDENLKFDLPKLNSKYSTVETKTYSIKVQKWIGYVKQINTESFIAELIDLSNGGTKEEGEFYFLQISPEDKPLLQIGAAFYWHVGFYIQNGQAKNDSFIRFQRLIKWSEEEYDNAIDEADYLYSKLFKE